ncbi:MAG: division/cell wall cluster transcriptional repressor MraZ [Hyphomicrobiales bacterium]|nr:division/cell wall cluster transcriptional repressor MraZ [Hyphomicrobiales bacterium]
MLGFRSTITNKVDAKGRVSVPAKFRSVIEAENLNSFICYPALRVPAIEAGGRKLAEENDSMLARLDPFSDEAESLNYMLRGASVELSFDSEGRVLLPEDLRKAAGITDAATFVGLGIRFQLWNPDAYSNEFAAAKKIAHDNRKLLRPSPSLSQGDGS